jgi:RNA polymerase sigma-70 factor (ECF subfamily)
MDDRLQPSGNPRQAAAHTGEGKASASPAAPRHDERELVAALRRGDEGAFLQLMTMYYGAMKRLALMYVPNAAVAEDVIQETWIGVLEGINRFEGRSSLKTWIFRILLNVAMTRGQREGRSVPFSALPQTQSDGDQPAVDLDRFLPPDHQWAGGWASLPHSWEHIPEGRLLSSETRARLREAIEMLPAQQRQVIVLRDVEGWSSDEVCNALAISETNQRVLLHRARSKVRHALEQYLDEE